MTELLLLMGKLMPEDKLIEMIAKDATEYGLTKNPETKKKMLTTCMILLAKEATEGKDIKEVANSLEETKRIHERLNSNQG